MTTKFMIYHMPTDPNWLCALGGVSVRHGHLDHELRLTIKTFERITPDEAMMETQRWSTRSLAERVTKGAKKVLGDCETFDLLKGLLKRASDLYAGRNAVIHGTIGKELDGTPMMRSDDNCWDRLRSPEELDELAEKIRVLTNEISNARHGGFLMAELVRVGHIAPKANA